MSMEEINEIINLSEESMDNTESNRVEKGSQILN